MSLLEDGIYEVIVVDAREDEDRVIALELAVSSGPHRGEVVNLRAANLTQGWMDLLAAPGTLVVTDGEPRLRLD